MTEVIFSSFKNPCGFVETQKKIEAIFKCQSLYDDGVPLFTKEAIRDIYQQLKKASEKVKISREKGEVFDDKKRKKFFDNQPQLSVRGLDGEIVTLSLSIGFKFKQSDQVEGVFETPCFNYAPIQELTELPDLDARFDAEHAFCSIRIYYRSVLRNTITKEIIPPFPIRPLEDVKKLYQKFSEEWKASELWKQLKTSLMSIMLEKSPGTISKILGLGCGPISPDDGDDETFARRSASQHAFLLKMRDILSETTEQRPDMIKCYIQDPAYNSDVDRPIFMEAGFTILEDPEAWLEVDDTTVVFTCAPDVPVRQLITDLARPAIMIWGRVGRNCNGEQFRTTDPESPRLHRMIHDFYDTFEFPMDRDIFSDLAIYVRKAAWSPQ